MNKKKQILPLLRHILTNHHEMFRIIKNIIHLSCSGISGQGIELTLTPLIHQYSILDQKDKCLKKEMTRFLPEGFCKLCIWSL